MRSIFALAVVLAVSALSAAAVDPNVEKLQLVADQIKSATNGTLDLSLAVNQVLNFVNNTNTNLTKTLNELSVLIGAGPESPGSLAITKETKDILKKLIDDFRTVLNKVLENIESTTKQKQPKVFELVVKTAENLLGCDNGQREVQDDIDTQIVKDYVVKFLSSCF